MKHPWQIWLAFALCAGLAIASLAWLTGESVRADLDRTTASRQAELEQKVSLVLWRMDTKLAPLIAEEVARPVSSSNDIGARITAADEFQAAGERVPIAWRGKLPDNVLMNFICPADLNCTSPQVPSAEKFGGMGAEDPKLRQRREQLQQLSQQIVFSELLDQLPADLDQIPADDAARAMTNGREVTPQIANNGFAGNRITEDQLKVPLSKGSNVDLQQRAQRYVQQTEQELRKRRENYANTPAYPRQAPITLSTPQSVIEGVSRPIWVGDNLLLARRVVIDGRTEVQGSWLNWPGIRKDLLAEATELLPRADLMPVHDASQADATRMLAGLPVLIDPGENFTRSRLSEPMQWALWIGWIAFLFALASAGVLLAGVVALSERRAAFVSSVTHELRTPLTTFRMYSDMLVRGMVPDAERRQQYLETLRSEAERLTHLVENVLSYARLERGRKVNRQETVTVEKIVERLEHRLAERAEQAEMQLVLDVDEGVERCRMTTDVGVVEQILFNLVDNACKYARATSDRRLHWEVQSTDNQVEMTIRDHGHGFDKPARAQRPQAFSKSAEEAAITAPGVGLGLALCRRLAKQLGGRLDMHNSPQGVRAVLRLPVERG